MKFFGRTMTMVVCLVTLGVFACASVAVAKEHMSVSSDQLSIAAAPDDSLGTGASGLDTPKDKKTKKPKKATKADPDKKKKKDTKKKKDDKKQL
jgi:hypothetical protein